MLATISTTKGDDMNGQLAELVDLHEAARAGGVGPRVDRKAGVIRHVRVLGWKSKNGREYDPRGINPTAYEGKPVNVGHSERGRDRHPGERFGWLQNVSKDSSGVWADLHFLKSDPLAEKVCEAAERCPALYGLSHVVAAGDYSERRQGGRVVIEAVHRVMSVDIVADPAATDSLFESRPRPRPAAAAALRESSAPATGWLGEHSRRERAAALRRAGRDVLTAGDSPAARQAHVVALRESRRGLALPSGLEDTPAARRQRVSALRRCR